MPNGKIYAGTTALTNGNFTAYCLINRVKSLSFCGLQKFLDEYGWKYGHASNIGPAQ
jgi:hypothetical protein